MKELIALEPGRAVLIDYEEGELKSNEIRIKSEISAEKHGTHLSFFLGKVPNVDKNWDNELELFIPRKTDSSLFPFHLGNITIGRIVEIGKDIEEFRVGDRVWGYLPIRETHTVDASRINLIPKGLTDEEVLCIDPATVALMSVREGRFSLGDRVAVFGLGAIGLLTVQMARLNGATFIIAIDPIEERRNLAKDFGADLILGTDIDVGLEIKLATNKKGVDVSIETSGSYRALHQAIRGTRYGGTIVTTSLYHGESLGLNLGEEWHINRHTMVSGIRVESEPYRDFPRWDKKRIYETVIELFKGKLLSVEGFLHIVPFEEVLSAYETLKNNPNKWIKLGVRY
ncbi:MAG: zinc-binding alcohol dehydrogenase [bacterium]|nr:zinc-binding alcohol dehydrogenase [bacterium]